MSEQTVKAPLSAAAPSAEEIYALVESGKRALGDGDLATALARFEEVIARFPNSREGHNNLGALYAALGCHEKADACFSRVLELAPGTANVHYNRGISRIRLRRFDDAAADFMAVLQAQPTDADSWNNLGVAHFLKGDAATAAANFRQALTLTPNYPNAVLNLVDAELARDRPDAAVAACESYLDGRADADVSRRLAELLAESARAAVARATAASARHLAETGDDDEVRSLHAGLTGAGAALSTPAAG